MVQITLKSSKTDTFHKGVDIVLGTTDDDLCPVKVLFNYLQKRGGGGEPGSLLIHRDGSPLTRSYFITRTRMALAALGYTVTDTCHFSRHCFWAGAAMTTVAMKVEDTDSIIKTLGR